MKGKQVSRPATRYGAGHVSHEHEGFWNTMQLDIYGDAPEQRGRKRVDQVPAPIGRDVEKEWRQKNRATTSHADTCRELDFDDRLVDDRIKHYLGDTQQETGGREQTREPWADQNAPSAQILTLKKDGESNEMAQLNSRMAEATWVPPLSVRDRAISPTEYERQVKMRSKLTDRAIHKAVMDHKTLNIHSIQELAGGGTKPTERPSKRVVHQYGRTFHGTDHFVGVATLNGNLPTSVFIDEGTGKRMIQPSPRNLWQAGGVLATSDDPEARPASPMAVKPKAGSVVGEAPFATHAVDTATAYTTDSASYGRRVGAFEAFVGKHDAPSLATPDDFTGLQSRRKKVNPIGQANKVACGLHDNGLTMVDTLTNHPGLYVCAYVSMYRCIFLFTPVYAHTHTHARTHTHTHHKYTHTYTHTQTHKDTHKDTHKAKINKDA